MTKRLISVITAIALAFTTFLSGGYSFASKASAERDLVDEEQEGKESAEDEAANDEAGDEKLTDEELEQIYEMAPIDEKGSEKIDKLPAIKKDETWTICIYMTGADLEDGGRNTLSDVVDFWADQKREEAKSQKYEKISKNLNRYEDELEAAGLEPPEYFFEPKVYMPEVKSQDDGSETDSFYGGAGTRDIDEMTSGVWSDNIRIVIQTGGAGYWVNQRINPNRVQRFEYYKGEFNEVDSMPTDSVCDSAMLTDFLRFCKDNYESDHRMLVLWDHGAGPFGYGVDQVTDTGMSLRDVRSALRNVYLPNPQNPAFDIIGYDACLMSNLDVAHSLYGFADYYCVSEEVEPGDGWDYGPFLAAMTNDPTLNPAQVGREVANSFMDYYMRQNLMYPQFRTDVTFSVLDAGKAEELYKAYCELAKAQLIDSIDNPAVLSEMGRCAGRATCYAMEYYDIYNCCDLGNYVDYMIDSYPDECSKIKDILSEAVLYHRENGVHHDSEGISVYIPFKVKSMYAVNKFLDYVYSISDDRSISALYYYKQAGCLNDEFLRYVKTLTDKEPEVLNVDAFKEFVKTDPDFDDYGFTISLSKELEEKLTDYYMELTGYDEKNDLIINYGKDYCVYLDGEGKLASNFDGNWIHMNDIPLSVEPITYSTDYAQYKAHVYYEYYDAYLILTRDLDTDQIYISGVKFEGNDVSNENNTRNLYDVEEGASIIPVYEIGNLKTKENYYDYDEEITFSDNTVFEYKPLKNGQYLTASVIQDQRGDSYYSKIIGVNMKNGTVTDWNVASEFYGSTY